MRNRNMTPLTIAVSLILIGPFQTVGADRPSVKGQLESLGNLPLTGITAHDEEFKRQLVEGIESLSMTQELPKNLQRRFDDIAPAMQLDYPDLTMVAKGASVPRSSGPRLDSPNVNIITPDNVRSMPLGASLWGSQSLFVRRSIFDMGVLLKASYIPNLQPETEGGASTMISSRTSRESKSEKFNQEYGLAARFGGWRGSIGFKRETAIEHTSMGGKATASIYNYATNTLRIEALQGDRYAELRGALRGADLGPDGILQYVAISEIPVNESEGSESVKYKRVKILGIYDGKATMSPRAHTQALMQLEILFEQLRKQYSEFTDAEIRQATLLDMIGLKKAINASIKEFYNNYGDSFVAEISGYSEVEGRAEMRQKSRANNEEANNAGTLTGGYNSFLGGFEAKASIASWAKKADAYGASEIEASATQRPNNGNDLSKYVTDLQNWINAAIKETGGAAALPSVQIQPSYPTPPVARDWQDDPFAPPKDVKEFADWMKSREAFKDSRGFKVPPWLKKKQEQEGKPPAENVQAAKEEVVQELNGQADKPEDDGQPDEMARSIVELFSELPFQSQSTPLITSASSRGMVESRSSRGVYGKKLYNRVRFELKALKAYGKKINAKERQELKKQGSWSTSASMQQVGDAGSPEIILDKSLVSNFTALPFSAVLETLRPNLELPIPIDAPIDGFINATVLLTTLNRYQTIETYLNFIKSIPESGLSQSNIPARVSDFVKQFGEEAMALLEASMGSGADISDELMAALLNNQILGMSEDGKSLNPKATKLYKILGQNMDAYNYLYTLAEKPEYYRVIGQAPGGYLPLAARQGDEGYCLPKLSEVKEIPGYRTPAGYVPRYLHATECVEVRPNTSIPALLAGSPQTPMYPLYRYIEKKLPFLNFVQFVGGSRIIVGRDITFAPPVSEVTNIPATPTSPVTTADLKAIGYQPNMLGDKDALKAQITETNNQPYLPKFDDKRTAEPEMLNAFLPSDLSFGYSLWFKDNKEESVSGYDRHRVLVARFGMYPGLYQNELYGENKPPRFYARGTSCKNPEISYCPVLTYQFLAPYSYQIAPEGDRRFYGLFDVFLPPSTNYLTGPTEQNDSKGNSVIGQVSLEQYGHAPGTYRTGGVLALYPLTTDMLQGLGSGAFTYSSGSSPKDIFNMNDKRESPFDAAYTKALLQGN